MLGRDHPDLAATLNNLARTVLDQRRFAEAAGLLERAIAINERQGRAGHDDMAFLYSNLATARRHLGSGREAEALYQRALETARAHEHRTLGPILADLADLRCRSGRTRLGMDLLAEAAEASSRDYPDDAWRSAWVENVRGECLVRAGRSTDGRAAISGSSPVILRRWPRNTLYGAEAGRRLQLASN